jgi:hypothetical protein
VHPKQLDKDNSAEVDASLRSDFDPHRGLHGSLPEEWSKLRGSVESL